VRFAVAVLGAGVVQIVPYLKANVPAVLAIAYLCFAAVGAGFFAGRRGWLAGGLSVIVGAALAGIVGEVGSVGAADLMDFLTAETGLLLVIVPYAFLGALAGALGGWLRSRALAGR
jgi:hypothetical protein